MTEDGSPVGPVHWPRLTADDAAEEWVTLRIWVNQLLDRYPSIIRLPDCWWMHNDFVEALSALRDSERASFGRRAPLAGPMDWQRALRDVEIRLETWMKRLTCSVPGRGHSVPGVGSAWTNHVEADVARRRAREVGGPGLV
jgi:hypothetical protein